MKKMIENATTEQRHLPEFFKRIKAAEKRGFKPKGNVTEEMLAAFERGVKSQDSTPVDDTSKAKKRREKISDIMETPTATEELEKLDAIDEKYDKKSRDRKLAKIGAIESPRKKVSTVFLQK